MQLRGFLGSKSQIYRGDGQGNNLRAAPPYCCYTHNRADQPRSRLVLELIQKNVGAEMRKVGLYLINVNIADITDESDYIESIGKKAAATAVEQARIDVANAERDGAIGKAEADRVKEIQVAQNTAEAEKGRKAAQADQRVYVEQQEAMAVGGENAAQAEIARANADLAEAEASAKQRADVATAQAEAEIQKAVYQEEESKLRASEIARETIAKQQVEIAADAEAERDKGESRVVKRTQS